MNLTNPNAQLFIPGGTNEKTALERITHLCIAAHQDDVEIMAYGPIAECYNSESKWFGAVVVTDGSGSLRDGSPPGGKANAEIKAIRAVEQNKAALIGRYSAMLQLGYESKAVKKPNASCTAEMAAIVCACRPQFLFTHNLFDKHDTHVAIAMRLLEALQLVPENLRPEKVYALEVWRGLDWLNDEAKVIFDTAPYPELALELLSVFASQIKGGKRYDLAAMGRRVGNATFLAPDSVDEKSSLTYGMDMTALVRNPDLNGFINAHLDEFRRDVLNRIMRTS
ncbi:MAG: PIG-L family deacetylase [Lachnospiraceae bacterium]|nr:PIG-L family deacetylase [Lachnospiraceae bacterium]